MRVCARGLVPSPRTRGGIMRFWLIDYVVGPELNALSSDNVILYAFELLGDIQELFNLENINFDQLTD